LRIAPLIVKCLNRSTTPANKKISFALAVIKTNHSVEQLDQSATNFIIIVMTRSFIDGVQNTEF